MGPMVSEAPVAGPTVRGPMAPGPPVGTSGPAAHPVSPVAGTIGPVAHGSFPCGAASGAIGYGPPTGITGPPAFEPSTSTHRPLVQGPVTVQQGGHAKSQVSTAIGVGRERPRTAAGEQEAQRRCVFKTMTLEYSDSDPLPWQSPQSTTTPDSTSSDEKDVTQLGK
ncbi:hypothetical protein Esti_005587 [Eimeria stiedai]